MCNPRQIAQYVVLVSAILLFSLVSWAFLEITPYAYDSGMRYAASALSGYGAILWVLYKFTFWIIDLLQDLY